MDAMSYHHFKQHLKDHLKQVNEDTIPLVVTFKNPDDNVVVMSKRDFDANEETMYLLNNPEPMARIRRGDGQITAGKAKRHDLPNV